MTALSISGHKPAKSLLKLGIIVSAAFVLLSGIVYASSGLSQGYTTTVSDLTPGSLMGLTPGTNSAVPASSAQSYQLLGLVADKPLIALSDGSNQVQVVISGPANALVSNINGDIKAGDRIASSPIVGVGMKAIDAGQVVGIAQMDFSKIATTDQTITDKSGTKHVIKVGAMPLQVSVSYFAGSSSQGALGSLLPPFVLASANSIAGQQVSPLRVLIGLLALVFGFVVAGIMLQAAVRSGMISVGRNPLAKKAVRKQLLDVCVTALVVLAVTAGIVYAVLKI